MHLIRLALCALLVALPVAASAAAYERPIPQAQSATVEHWFFLASVSLLLALAAVGWLVRRR